MQRKDDSARDAIDTLDRIMWGLGGALIATALLAIGFYAGRLP
jgi:hypothetical protein